MNPLERIINYAYVGLIPNAIGALCAHDVLDSLADGNYLRAVAQTLPAALNVWVGYLKFAEYRRVKATLEERGWDERIVKPKMYSWCQRHAARQAARQTGYGAEFDAYATREGHRWYHLLPKIHRFGEVARAIEQRD